MIRMETERMILREFRGEDIDDYFRLKSDPAVMYYLPDLFLPTRGEAERDLAAVLEDQRCADRRFWFFRMELKTTGEQIGSIGYTLMPDAGEGRTVQIGYFLFPAFWRLGYAAEALRRVLEFAFMENGVEKAETGCLAENRGSERVMQKCGMILERELKDHTYHDGKMKTRLEYRLLKREWEEQVCRRAGREEEKGETSRI